MVRGTVVAACLTVVLGALGAPRALGGPSAAEGGSGPRLTVSTANIRQEPAAVARIVDVIRRSGPTW